MGKELRASPIQSYQQQQRQQQRIRP